MYSSLLKVDIVLDEKGRAVLVQTDHRDRAEVERELELSVIFALTRLLSPLRSDEWKGASVRYVAIGELHPTLATVIASTGQAAESSGKPFDLSGVTKRAPADLANDAFVGLAAKVIARERISLDAEGLAAFEARIAAAPPKVEEDEIAYWTTVAELAAVTGEVLRSKHGGRWTDDARNMSEIPFLFESGTTLVNPVGKACRFIAHGEPQSPRQLLMMLEESRLPQGPLLLNMKPASWPARAQAICEPLFPEMTHLGADMPLVVYGHDQPQSFAMFTVESDPGRELASLRAEALSNLAKVDVVVERVQLDALTFWAVHGSFFAAEKILDVAFMKEMHRRIGSDALAVATPLKGQLFVMNAVVEAQETLAFMALVRGAFTENEGGRQLSPTIFLVMDGVANGIATPAEPEPPKKKGFFSRWFN